MDTGKEKTLEAFEYYLAHQDDMIKLYDGKFVAIKGTKVLGVYDSQGDALRRTSKGHRPGTFIIQKATKTIRFTYLPQDAHAVRSLHDQVV